MLRLPLNFSSSKRDKQEETKSESRTVSNEHKGMSRKNEPSPNNQLHDGKSHYPKMTSKKKSTNQKINLKERIALPLLRKKQHCRDDITENDEDFSLSTGEANTFTTQNQDMAYHNPVQVIPSQKSRLRHAVKEIWTGRLHKKKQSRDSANSGKENTGDNNMNHNNTNNDDNIYPISVKQLQEEYGVVWDDHHNNPIHHKGVVVDDDKNSNVVDSVYSSKYQINDDDSTRSTHRSLRELGFAWCQRKASWEHKDPNCNNENCARSRTLSADYMISRN